MSARILVIEDDPDFLELMTYELRNAGYTLLTATDGQAGLALAQQEKPDLILTDLMLPKLTGYEVCTTLKQDPATREIPILMLSATMVEPEGPELAKKSGADEFLLKTMDPKQLLAKVQARLSPVKEPGGGG